MTLAYIAACLASKWPLCHSCVSNNTSGAFSLLDQNVDTVKSLTVDASWVKLSPAWDEGLLDDTSILTRTWDLVEDFSAAYVSIFLFFFAEVMISIDSSRFEAIYNQSISFNLFCNQCMTIGAGLFYSKNLLSRATAS